MILKWLTFGFRDRLFMEWWIYHSVACYHWCFRRLPCTCLLRHPDFDTVLSWQTCVAYVILAKVAFTGRLCDWDFLLVSWLIVAILWSCYAFGCVPYNDCKRYAKPLALLCIKSRLPGSEWWTICFYGLRISWIDDCLDWLGLLSESSHLP